MNGIRSLPEPLLIGYDIISAHCKLLGNRLSGRLLTMPLYTPLQNYQNGMVITSIF